MKKLKSSKELVMIFNATPIITLRELEYGNLIAEIRRACSVKIIIPQRVKEEFTEAGQELDIPSDDIEAEQLASKHHIDVPLSIGKGERQAIEIAYALAQEAGMDAVIVVTDDKRARNKCEKLGISVIGTLGLIEYAKKHQVIPKEKALALLDKIPSTSLHITPELLEKARNQIKQQ